MAKKKRGKRIKRIDLNLEKYQKAIRRAEDPDVVQRLQDIYSSSEKRRVTRVAEDIARKTSKGFFGTGFSGSKISPREKVATAIARKAINLVAPSGSLVRTITRTGKKKGSRGRGRPRETYKVRYLPSGKVVKVPTHIYKKMLSAEKSQMRLLQAQRMAQASMQADQVAMQTDQRYQPGSEEQFLAEPDQIHEMDVIRAKQQAEFEQMRQEVPQGQGPGVGKKIMKGVGNFGRGLANLGNIRRRPMLDEYGMPIEQPQQFQRALGADMRPVDPKVTVLGGKANILNVPNEFNNPNQSTILWNKRRRSS